MQLFSLNFRLSLAKRPGKPLVKTLQLRRARSKKRANSPGVGEGGVLPINDLMGMCCWMGLHFFTTGLTIMELHFKIFPERATRMGSQSRGRKMLARGI